MSPTGREIDVMIKLPVGPLAFHLEALDSSPGSAPGSKILLTSPLGGSGDA